MSDAKEYLEKQGLSDAMTVAVKQVIAERPENAQMRVAELLAGGAISPPMSPPTATPKALEGATYYSFPPFPSPGMPEAYAAELGCLDALKGIYKFIDSPAGENRTEEYKANVNAMGELPCIKFADGSVLTESIAICQFLEEGGFGKPGVSLLGKDAKERATILMWQRRVEQTICLPAMNATRSGLAREIFKNRGTHSFLIPEQSQSQIKLARSQMEWLEAQMTAAGGDFICLNKCTIADVQLFIHVRFMTSFMGLGAAPIPDLKDHLPWIEAWYKRMEARPCAGAEATMMS